MTTDEHTKCDRCGNQMYNNALRFCDGKYYFCQKCSSEWLELLKASGGSGWNSCLFEWWLKYSSYKTYNPSKRF